LRGSNKAGFWTTTREAVAEWLGVEVEDVRNPHFAPTENVA
jgi:hypothetical protein